MPQSLSQIYVHLVFSTKQRNTFLKDETITSQLYAYLAGICQKRNCFTIIIGGDTDHVHLLFALSRQKNVADLVRELKTSSAIWVKQNQPPLSDFQWQSGYGAFSVSQSQLEKVKNYIALQKEHHKQMSFQEEFRRLLKSHNVEFDEKYVWD